VVRALWVGCNFSLLRDRDWTNPHLAHFSFILSAKLCNERRPLISPTLLLNDSRSLVRLSYEKHSLNNALMSSFK